MADLSVNICGVEFKNPIIPASGAFGFGREYLDLYPLEALGGLSCKGTTLHGQNGNPAPRVAETACGMLNSVGLQNAGIDHFIQHELPFLASQDIAVIANVAGHTVEDCVEIATRLQGCAIDMIELNISCPNVKQGGAAFGTCATSAAEITRAVKEVADKPVMVKLSPNVTSIVDIAKAVEDAGADAVSLINTLVGMRIDLKTRRPILKNNVGGLSGPAVFPVAVRMVWQVANAVRVPVMGMGGVACAEDAIEMMMAGASAVQMGAALFNDPLAPIKTIAGMNDWLDAQNISSVGEIVGTVKPW